MEKQNKTKVKAKGLEIPLPLYKVIYKESVRRTMKEGKRVSEHSLIIDALMEKFLPNAR